MTTMELVMLLAVLAPMVIVDGSDTCLRNADKKAFQKIKTTLQQLENGIAGRKLAGPGCKNGWKIYRNHCYFFSTETRTWFESERFCREHGSSLANIENAEEQSWISSTRPKDVNVWLGGSDMKEGQWLWTVDFKPFSYANWNPGEPNGNTRQNCVYMYQTKYDGKWDDSGCENKYFFVCKRALYVTGQCPDGGTCRENGKTFTVIKSFGRLEV